MKNARITTITHRLFALVMALLLAAGGFMMDVQAVHAETVPESYTTTTYTGNNTTVKIEVNNVTPGIDGGGWGTSANPSDWWDVGSSGMGYPIILTSTFLGENVVIGLSPVGFTNTFSIVNPNTSEVVYEAPDQHYDANLVTGRTVTGSGDNPIGPVTFSTTVGGTTHYTIGKQSSKYQVKILTKSVAKGSVSAKYEEYYHGDEDSTTGTHSRDKYTIIINAIISFENESGGTTDVFNKDITFEYYPQGGFKDWIEDDHWLKYTNPPQIPEKKTDTYNSSQTFQIVKNYTPAGYHNPIVTKNPALIQTVGEEPTWTHGIEATWGNTTSNVITSTSTAADMGTITDDSLSGGTDEALSSDGATFDKIGIKQHSYTIKDAHSLSSASQYAGDNTSASVSRNIIVKTSASPDLEAYYEGTDTVYGGEWLSQYNPGDETAPDADHYKKIDLKASGSGIAGTYDTVIWSGDSEEERAQSSNAAELTFGTETGTDGKSFFANLQEANNGTIASGAGLTALSGNSASKTVKIDSTPPTTSITVKTDDNDLYAGLTNGSSDTLSGIDKTFVSFVEAGGDAPTITNGTWTEIGSVAEGTTYEAGKTYDIYAYSIDNATNKSSVMKFGNPVTTPSIDISVEKHLKDTSIEKVQKGDELEYVIKVKNAGTAPATDYQIVDTLPAGLTYVSGTEGAVVNDQVITWTKTIPAGEEIEINVKAKVTGAPGDKLKNTVVVRDDNGDPVDEAEDDSEEVEVKKPQAKVTKTADKDKVKFGDEIAYTIAVKNTGEVPVKDWTVTDTLGDGLTYVSNDSGGTNNGQVTEWTVSLAVGETKEIILVAKVADKDGAIKNGVEIRGDETDDPATEEDESIEDEDESESTLQFDVTFVDEDGETVLKEKTAYDYKTAAADIVKPEDPKKAPTDKYVYVFKGWEPEISDVTEDIVYKATYEEKKKYYLPKDKDDDEPVNPEDPFDEDGEEPEIGDTFIGEDGEEYKIIEIGEPDPNTGEIPIKVGKLFTLTFNLEGGKLDGQTDVIKVKELKNETIIILGEPTREGYKFEYWQGSKYYPGDEYKVTDHHTFTAIWTKLPDETLSSTKTPDSKDKSSDSKSANTGDENNLLLWSILLWASAVGVVVAREKRRKV